jgi:hypothetical protein
VPTFRPVSANVAQAKQAGAASKSLQPSRPFKAQTPYASGPAPNRRWLIQAKMVHLPDGYVALDDDPESIVNDGEIKYKLIQTVGGTRHYLEDNWGRSCFTMKLPVPSIPQT